MKKILIINFLDKQQWANEVPYLWLTMRSYFLRNSKDPSAWEWLDPFYSSYAENMDELVDNIVSQSPDVIGISCYIWNERITLTVANKVKQKLPSVKIVAGGPGIYIEQDKGWFNKHPYIDAVCEYTGFGEIFITEYLDGTPLEDIPFCIYPSMGGLFWNKSTASFKRRDLKFSMPYTDNQEYLKKFASKHDKIKFLVETSRGCPYSCTFCEWGYSVSKKVVFRDTADVCKDLEVAFEILKPMSIEILDANFGIVETNIDVTRKIAELNNLHNGCVIYMDMGGPSKVKKENVNLIYKTLLDAGINVDFRLSVQHTNQEILDNIERVETPLSDQVKIFKPLMDEKGFDLRIDGIIGLPGETLDRFYQMMDDMTIYPALEPWCYQWVMLSGTPAAEPEYIKKMKIKTRLFKLNADASEFDCIDQVIPRNLYQQKIVETGKRRLILDQEWRHLQSLVVGTYSYGSKEWVEMNMFYIYYSYLRYNKIIVPIVVHLREKGVNIKEFYKGFFDNVLMNNPILNRVYHNILSDLENEDETIPIDFEFVSIGPGFPYLSHRALLKFIILLSPNEFFGSVAEWLESRYGEDKYLKLLCSEMAATIRSPGKKDIPLPQKIQECLQMCKQIMREQDRLLPKDFKLK